MRIGSLCSGIGGLELGLERAGLGTTAWQVEYDPHASEVLARHWPGVPNHGDVKLTDWAQVEPVDVICAGYPCQPFSTAGRRQGTDDDRHLWPAVRDAVGVLGPRLVVLENVRGHLSLGFPEVLGDLADLGFDAGWCLLRASDVGAPHQRARLFVAAYANVSGRGRRNARGRQSETGRGTRRGSGEGQEAARGSGPATPDAPVERGERDGRPRDGRPRDGRTRLADASGLSAADTAGTERRASQSDPLGTAAGRAAELGERRSSDTWGPYETAVRRWEAIHGPAPAPTTDGRLSPDFVCWMQGFPPGWVDGLTRTAALRCLGNAVVPAVAERFGRMILGESNAQPEYQDPPTLAKRQEGPSTSLDHGPASRARVAGNGARSPQERRPAGQPDRESGSARRDRTHAAPQEHPEAAEGVRELRDDLHPDAAEPPPAEVLFPDLRPGDENGSGNRRTASQGGGEVVLLPTPNTLDGMAPRSDEALARAKTKGGCSNLKDVIPRLGDAS